MNSTRRSWILLCTLAVLAAPLAAQEPEKAPGPQKNIRVTIKYDVVEVDGTRMVKTREILAQDGSAAELLIGSRVPIAVTEVGDGRGDRVPITSFTYQNIGFSAKLRASIHADGRIGVEAEIESSRVSPETAEDDNPVIHTYQQRIRVVLEDGKAMQVTRVEDPERVTGHFELTARVVE